MKSRQTILLGASVSALIIGAAMPGLALAQNPPLNINSVTEQPVVATSVVRPGQAVDLQAFAEASANAASANPDNGLIANGFQSVRGGVASTATMQGGETNPSASAIAFANGNGFSATTRNGALVMTAVSETLRPSSGGLGNSVSSLAVARPVSEGAGTSIAEARGNLMGGEVRSGTAAIDLRSLVDGTVVAIARTETSGAVNNTQTRARATGAVTQARGTGADLQISSVMDAPASVSATTQLVRAESSNLPADARSSTTNAEAVANVFGISASDASVGAFGQQTVSGNVSANSESFVSLRNDSFDGTTRANSNQISLDLQRGSAGFEFRQSQDTNVTNNGNLLVQGNGTTATQNDTALGNWVAIDARNFDASGRIAQTRAGGATASTTIEANSYSGALAGQTAATGNLVTGTLNSGALRSAVEQRQTGGLVSSVSTIRVDGDQAPGISQRANASTNQVALNANTVAFGSRIEQAAPGSTFATNNLNLQSASQVESIARADTNAVAVNGPMTGRLEVSQSGGTGAASVTIRGIGQQNSASSVAGTAVARSNSVDLRGLAGNSQAIITQDAFTGRALANTEIAVNRVGGVTGRADAVANDALVVASGQNFTFADQTGGAQVRADVRIPVATTAETGALEAAAFGNRFQASGTDGSLVIDLRQNWSASAASSGNDGGVSANAVAFAPTFQGNPNTPLGNITISNINANAAANSAGAAFANADARMTATQAASTAAVANAQLDRTNGTTGNVRASGAGNALGLDVNSAAMSFTGTQTFTGEVRSGASLSRLADGAYTATATADGNAFGATVQSASASIDLRQSRPVTDNAVTARSSAFGMGGVTGGASNAFANGNSFGLAANAAAITTTLVQRNEAGVAAVSDFAAPRSTGVASVVASATGNLAGFNLVNASLAGRADQLNSGAVDANATLNVADLRQGGFANAAGIGNNLLVTTGNQPLTFTGTQTNSGPISATANIGFTTLGGPAGARADAIGNLGTLVTTGTGAGFALTQMNTGAITAIATGTGPANPPEGFSLTANATGNVFQAAAQLTGLPGTANFAGTINQTTTGPITANVFYNGGPAVGGFATATALGNVVRFTNAPTGGQ
ncbi:MAG: hypothetical protein MUF14_02750 [Hyphomonadaceae bacterium]|jgi:hypothetical protein|nr:hypothetical protein [Hyphomonadaceae bacterium]